MSNALRFNYVIKGAERYDGTSELGEVSQF